MVVKLVQKRVGGEAKSFENDPSLVDGTLDTAFIKDLHLALTNPDGDIELPAMPTPEADVHDFTAYWEPALHLLVYLLGWSNPANGLKWWYANGKDDMGDSRLRMLKAGWDYDGQLDLLAAWFWQHGYDVAQPLRQLAGKREYSWSPVEPVDPGRQWWSEFRAKYPMRENEPSPLGYAPYHPGSSNPIHLDRSPAVLNGPPISGTILMSDESKRTAVVLLDMARGWYHQLHHHGSKLPDLGDRSWHVHVVVKPLAWLGVFRRSRETGLWFQGKHSLHMKGQ